MTIDTRIEIIKEQMRPLSDKKHNITDAEAIQLQGLMYQLDAARDKRDSSRGEGRVKAAFSRDPTEEEALYERAGNKLLQAFIKGRAKPVKVRFMAIPEALGLDGRCSVSLPDEYRIIATNQKGEARKFGVFLHELKHAIDSANPARWEHLCKAGVIENMAKRAEFVLDGVARKAASAVMREDHRTQQLYGTSPELEKIKAVIRCHPDWLREFSKQ